MNEWTIAAITLAWFVAVCIGVIWRNRDDWRE